MTLPQSAPVKPTKLFRGNSAPLTASLVFESVARRNLHELRVLRLLLLLRMLLCLHLGRYLIELRVERVHLLLHRLQLRLEIAHLIGLRHAGACKRKCNGDHQWLSEFTESSRMLLWSARRVRADALAVAAC